MEQQQNNPHANETESSENQENSSISGRAKALRTKAVNKNGRKKCGEIYITDDKILDFLCKLCEEEALFNEIESFVDHVKRCKQKLNETLQDQLEYDPLEPIIDCKILDFQSINTASEIKNFTSSTGIGSIEVKTQKIETENNYNAIEVQTDDKVSGTICLKQWKNEPIKKKRMVYSVQEFFSCNVCDKEYVLKSSLRRHVKSAHGKNSDKSDEILRKRTSENHQKLLDSLKVSDNVKKKEFDHLTSNNDDDDEDDDGLTEEIILDAEKNIPPHIDPYTCRYCNKRYKTKLKRTEHEYSHTLEKPYKCETCGKRFQFVYNFKRHVEIHLNIRRHKCDICSSKFSQRCALIVHKRRHTGEKAYKCNYCDKHFVQATERNRHERVHTGEKRFQCHICGERFIHQSNLIVHNRHHLGIKPHKCNNCGKDFYTKGDLDAHIVVHTRERPFSCTICNATFPRKCTLKKHEKSHSDNREYVCNICGKSFKLSNILRRHIKTHGQSSMELKRRNP